MKLGIVLVLAVSAAGCVAGQEQPDLATRAEAIVGGIEDSTPGVVSTRHVMGECTGTVVGERVVLTAAHCIEDDFNNDDHRGTISFGDGGAAGFPDSVGILRLAPHRYFDMADIRNYDIGLIRLRDPIPDGAQIHPFNLDPLDNLVGEQVRTVGFGYTDGVAETGAGTKRSAFFTVAAQTAFHLSFGDEDRNICQGDSGGPTFANIDGVDTVVAVSSFTSDFCMGASSVVRTDAYRDFLIEVFDAWDGPCQHDGNCVTAGCRTPDPDCAPCGFDAFCDSGCDTLDLDCPIVGFAGDLCDNNDGCESRVCVGGLDDPRVEYCSGSCDPSMPADTQCDPPLTVCRDDGGGGRCYYEGISPGAQGSPCTSETECRSGVCDPDELFCIEQCGDGFPECRDPYECVNVGGVKACTFGDGGGCAVAAGHSPNSRSGAWCAWLLVAMVFAMRRRRS